jgi:penicillin-binding protein 1A
MLGVGIDATIEHAAKFGFDPKSLPRHCSLALGTLSATPLQMATAYAVFANGGFKVEPYLVRRVEDRNGKVLFEATPKVACAECEKVAGAGDAVPEDRRAPRVISAQNAWLVSDILHDAAARGTGKGTQVLGRDDLAGKTGTTDEARDNWFNGFNQRLVATVWMGFDDYRSLGEREEGASTAVPVWNRFMAEALRGMPSSRMERPDGIVEALVSSATGEVLEADAPDARVEFFMEGHGPAPGPALAGSGAGAGTADGMRDPFE